MGPISELWDPIHHHRLQSITFHLTGGNYCPSLSKSQAQFIQTTKDERLSRSGQSCQIKVNMTYRSNSSNYKSSDYRIKDYIIAYTIQPHPMLQDFQQTFFKWVALFLNSYQFIVQSLEELTLLQLLSTLE
jgi:hypothetical protein